MAFNGGTSPAGRRAPLLPRPPSRLLRDELETPAEATHGLRVSEHSGGKLRRVSVIAPRAVGSATPVVLFGQLSSDLVLALAMQDLETLRDPTMEQPSLRR
jgi:hypothetical protein